MLDVFGKVSRGMISDALNRETWVRAALERYERPLLHYALRITRNAELARDVVQDTFLRLCKADPDRVNEHLAAWLYTVCRNRALSLSEKEARMTGLNEEFGGTSPGGLVAAHEDPFDTAARNDSHRQALAVIGTLPKEQQEAVRLKFQDGLNYREISGIMNVSLGTVSHLITTALVAVRRELEPDTNRPQEVQS